MPVEYVDTLTRADRGAGDSVHLLVLDLHRELNRLQRDIAEESVDGATVYGLAESDRVLVAAFMAGVNGRRRRATLTESDPPRKTPPARDRPGPSSVRLAA